jgi:DNA-binding NtrC family response regulator
MMKYNILVVDDEESIRKLLQGKFEREGYTVKTADGAAAAFQALSSGESFACIITDVKMPGVDGITFTLDAKKQYPRSRIVVITGHGDKKVAIEALRNGASDYLEKPFDMEDLSHSVRRSCEEYQMEVDRDDYFTRLESRVERVEGKNEDEFWYVSQSGAMAQVNEWLQVLRRESLRGEAEEPTVLLMGESGTGKEGIARMVHAGSRRARGPWVAINCANFTEQLLESELFGHEKGSFTGAVTQKRGLLEIAKGGTLFLDELGEMDVKLQAKLLRFLQEKTYRRVGGNVDMTTDIRVVAATNQNLPGLVEQGKFRADLYHRLARVVIDIPSLRNRTDDVVPMAKKFAERGFRARGKKFTGFTPEAETMLTSYPWPGNVRELLNVMERIALLNQEGGVIGKKDLNLPAVAGTGNPTGERKLELVTNPYSAPTDSSVGTYTELKKRWCDAFEREYLISSLQRHGGNVSSAAREAQIDRSNFLRLMRRHGLVSKQYRAGDTDTATGTGGGEREVA